MSVVMAGRYFSAGLLNTFGTVFGTLLLLKQICRPQVIKPKLG